MNKYDAVIVGMDLGDQWSQLCALSEAKKVVWRKSVRTRRDTMKAFFEALPTTTVVIEAGAHSMWMNELIEELGHRVIVANSRALGLIYGSNRKNDRNDAEKLARLGLADEELLSPIVHRSLEAHADLALVRARCRLVEGRTKLINAVRGMVKIFGERLSSCSAEGFHKLEEDVPPVLRAATVGLFVSIRVLSVEIKALDKRIEWLCKEKYPETERLREIRGVGPVTALIFVLIIEDRSRFKQSRQVGAYLGLVPKQDQSGASDPQLGITKAGDTYLRSLLLQCAHYILGRHGEDCDLRDFGLRLFDRGGKYAKARAAVAVARKLSILLHRLWVTGEHYDPHRNRARQGRNVKIYELKAA